MVQHSVHGSLLGSRVSPLEWLAENAELANIGQHFAAASLADQEVALGLMITAGLAQRLRSKTSCCVCK